MVTFTCMHCSASLRKPAVKKHLCHCSTNELACIDCGESFTAVSYQQHTSCLTEEQKYYGQFASAPSSKKKRRCPQERWMSSVQFIATSPESAKEKPIIQAALRRLTEADNVPRKKSKFLNYMKNSFRSLPAVEAERLFVLIDTHNTSVRAKEEAAAKALAEKELRNAKRKAGDGLGCQKGLKKIRWRKTCREVLGNNNKMMSLKDLQAGVIKTARDVFSTSGALTGINDAMIRRIVQEKVKTSKHLLVSSDLCISLRSKKKRKKR
eukprot:g928.t1